MPTNSPATPLPWAVPGTDGGEYVICSDGSHGKRRTVAHGYESTNAAYIVQACNAYPQLVEALRKATERIAGEFCSHDGRCGPDTHDCYVREEMALLRSLGEKV